MTNCDFRSVFIGAGIVLACLATAANSKDPPDPGNRFNLPSKIVIEDEVSGCFSSSRVATEYVHRGHEYVSPSKKINESVVAELQQTIVGAKPHSEPDLGALGITEDAIKQHLSEIVSSTTGGKYKTLSDLPAKFKPLYEPQKLLESMRESLKGNIQSSTDYTLTVTLEGAHPNKISSRSLTPMKLPWLVQDGDRFCGATYSPRVSLLVSQLADPKGTSAQMIDENYWKDEVYKTGSAFMDQVFSVSEDENEQRIEAIPGYANALRHWKIENARAYETAYDVTLENKRPYGLVNLIFWKFGAKNFAPESDFNVVSKQADDIESRMKRLPWLRKWIETTPHRVVIYSFNQQYHWSDYQSTNVARLWKQANLPGEPKFEVSLTNQDRHTTVIVTFGSDGDRTMINDELLEGTPDGRFCYLRNGFSVVDPSGAVTVIEHGQPLP